MRKTSRHTRRIAWTGSVFSAAIMIFLGYLTFGGSKIFDEFVVIAVLIAVFPPTILNYVDYRWRKAVDERLPDLFRCIVQFQETGMTIPQALEEVAKRDYGPLSVELKKMTTQISWGMTLEEAFLSLGRRVRTELMQRVAPIITEASRAGGRIETVFDPMGKFIKTTLLLNEERRNQTRPYIAIIYVAFFVFLFTIILLFKSFFAGLNDLQMLQSALMTPEEMQRIFFHMTMIQAFFGGVVAGKMGEGKVSAGLKHSIVLMICGYATIKLFL